MMQPCHRYLRRIAFLVVAVSAALLIEPVRAGLYEEVKARTEAEYPSLGALYVHFHENPELSYQEKESSARIARELTEAGLEVTTHVGGYGVVGLIRNGAGPTVLVRGDMDALPVKELTGLPFASKVTARDDSGAVVPVMHACGHDVHMTCLVGVARLLMAFKDRWSGTVVLIAQPAEERGGGARAMLADGLFTRFPRPDYALALHVDSSLPVGRIGHTSGYAMANVDSVDIIIRGVGGHGAYPEQAKDPVVLAAQVVLGLQTIVSREIRTQDAAVVTVGSIHGGTKHNIIPGEVKLQLTVRSYTDEVRQHVLRSIERITLGMAEAAGIPPGLEPIIQTAESEYTPALYNDPALTKRIMDMLERHLGPGNIIEARPMMGGEDFGRYGREEPRVPILMMRLGSVSLERLAEARNNPGNVAPAPHSPFYYPDAQPTIQTGVVAITMAVAELLKPGK